MKKYLLIIISIAFFTKVFSQQIDSMISKTTIATMDCLFEKVKQSGASKLVK